MVVMSVKPFTSIVKFMASYTHSLWIKNLMPKFDIYEVLQLHFEIHGHIVKIRQNLNNIFLENSVFLRENLSA